MNLRRITALFGLLLLVILPAQVSASSPPVWTEPLQIGAELPSSWFPDIHADAAGNVFTVYSAALIEGDANEIDGLNGAVVISELGEGGWSEPADIAVMDGGIASRPMLVSDGQYAHLIYRTADVGDPVLVVYSRAPLTADLGDARSWSPPFKLSTDEAYWTQIGLLPDGGLLVVYNRISGVQVDGKAERRTGIVARRSDDQGETWGDEVRIADTEARVARISMAVAPDSDDVVVVWDEGYDNLTAQGEPTAIASAVSEDGGTTWADQQRFVEPAEQATVATDGATTVWLYRSTTDSTLFYRTSVDGGRVWTDQQPVPDALARPYSNPHNFDKLSAAFDSDGRLLFTWVGPNEDAPNDLSIMLATLADGEWTAPQAISSQVGFPEYPRIAVSLGNRVELTYFVRDKEFDIGAYTMWTMSASSDAGARAPVVYEAVYAPTETVPTPVPVTIDQQPAAPGITTPVSDVTGWDATPQATLTSPIVPILVVTVAGLLIVAVVRLAFLYLRDAGI